MSGNSIGKLFTVTSFGESHGPSIGCIVDGCPPGLALCEADLQGDLDRRRPGKTRFETQRKELDRVKILSGVFEGKTTGTPIGMLIEIPISDLKITAISCTSLDRLMRITPTIKNMASVITEAVDVLRHVKLRCELQRVVSPKSI